jgi:glycosyltransferase involved in cell wall biosynthesis
MISVIIPVYGVEKYIERCCVSVFEQTYKNFELIFVNDCSKDKSKEIVLAVIERYKSLGISIKSIEHELNKGVSASRETGLIAAIGQYVLYIDSDDYIAPNMLELLINKANETNADIVYCDFYEVKNGQQLYFDQSLQLTDPILITVAMLKNKIVWTPWNKLFRRSLAVEHDIHWPVGINIGEDLVVMTQLFCFANKIVHVNKALYFYNRDNMNSYLNIWNKVSCCQNTKAVEAVSGFISRHVNNPILLEALVEPKLMARYQMLYSFDAQLLKQSAETFTETNDKVFSYPNAPIYWKVALYFLVKKQKALTFLTLKSIFLLKKIKQNVCNLTRRCS